MENLNLTSILSEMTPISLEEMKGVKLMDRNDLKYIATDSKLEAILKAAEPYYYVQEAAGVRLSSYHTIYFDTPGMAMYLEHHNKRSVRQKIRIRTYVESHLTFIEVKDKDNKSKTHKHRIQIPTETIDDDARAFLARRSRYSADEIMPVLDETFHRITLVSKSMKERLTIDTEITYRNLVTGKTREMKDLVVLESKTEGDSESKARQIFLEERVRPTNFSKYCIGCALTDPSLKRNNFKTKLRYLDKITNNTHEYAC